MCSRQPIAWRATSGGSFVTEPDGWYRLVTSGFMHFGIIHIGFNMYFLYVLGPMLERPLGRVRFLLLYFASLLGGSLGVVLFDSGGITAGASGAVFGLMACRRGRAVATRASTRSPRASARVLLLNLFITFAIPGISIGGHLGGAIAGAVCGAVMLAPATSRCRPGRPMRCRLPSAGHEHRAGRDASSTAPDVDRSAVRLSGMSLRDTHLERMRNGYVRHADRRRRYQRRRHRRIARRTGRQRGADRPWRLRQLHQPGVVEPRVGRLQVPRELRAVPGVQAVPVAQPADEGLPGQHQADRVLRRTRRKGPVQAVVRRRSARSATGSSGMFGTRRPRLLSTDDIEREEPAINTERSPAASSTATASSSTTTPASCSASSARPSRPAPPRRTTSRWCRRPSATASGRSQRCGASTPVRSSSPTGLARSSTPPARSSTRRTSSGASPPSTASSTPRASTSSSRGSPPNTTTRCSPSTTTPSGCST